MKLKKKNKHLNVQKIGIWHLHYTKLLAVNEGLNDADNLLLERFSPGHMQVSLCTAVIIKMW